MKTAAQVRKERKADAFNKLVLSGCSQADAWRKVNPRKRGMSEDSIRSLASQYAQSPFVTTRLQTYLASAKIADLDTEGRAHSDILRVMGAAEAEQNYTAFAALARVRSQHLKLLNENINIAHSAVSDDELIKALAGDDAQLAAQIRRKLGRAAFDAAPANNDDADEDANVVALRKAK